MEKELFEKQISKSVAESKTEGNLTKQMPKKQEHDNKKYDSGIHAKFKKIFKKFLEK